MAAKNDREPLLTVICTTYNHERYVAQALDGFLAQRCSYPFEVLVHDDASTDSTARVVRDYAGRYPDLFRTILQTENQYSKGVDIWNLLFEHSTAARYIAVCEGDDYWTDPLKLQRQLDYMEAHPECGLAYGRARVFDQSCGKFGRLVGGKSESLEAILRANPVPTLTTVFRRDLYLAYTRQIDPMRYRWRMADYPLWIYLAAHGTVHFDPSVLAVYRVLPNSASHTDDPSKKTAFLQSAQSCRRVMTQRLGLEGRIDIDSVDIFEMLELSSRIQDREKWDEAIAALRSLCSRRVPSRRMRFTLRLARMPWLYQLGLRVARSMRK